MADRRKGRLWKWVPVASVVLTGGTMAFLTAYDAERNIAAVGHNTTGIEEEFPEITPVPVNDNPYIRKSVWVANRPAGENGFNADCYVRVALGYSNYDVGKAVILEERDEENWKYDPGDGYYYYTEVLTEGEKTTPLFTGITIDSSKIDDTYWDKMTDFEVQVYEESVQAKGYKDYRSAWDYYGNPI